MMIELISGTRLRSQRVPGQEIPGSQETDIAQITPRMDSSRLLARRLCVDYP